MTKLSDSQKTPGGGEGPWEDGEEGEGEEVGEEGEDSEGEKGRGIVVVAGRHSVSPLQRGRVCNTKNQLVLWLEWNTIFQVKLQYLLSV